MVMTLRKRVPPIPPQIDSESETETSPKRMKTQRNPKPAKRRENFSSSESDSEKENEGLFEYEKIREQRIRENRERMEKLGIFTLSSQLLNGNKKGVRRKNPPLQKKKRYPPLYPRVRDRSYDAARRSARILKIYEKLQVEGCGVSSRHGDREIVERYGDFNTGGLENRGLYRRRFWAIETEWTLEADGLDEDGDRLYNPDGTPCHQCRQRVLGKLTYCCKCRSPQGKICGDCLYKRYGENVLEAVENPTWSCPACRGICNCSRCRRTKGWEPINIQHSKIIESGFKSVAHYLILTRRAGATQKELNGGAVVVDLTEEETMAAPEHNEGFDYSAELSEFESDDSDSEDDSKGEKNQKEQSVESKVGTTKGSNEAAAASGMEQAL